jgi:hypothetical protein
MISKGMRVLRRLTDIPGVVAVVDLVLSTGEGVVVDLALSTEEGVVVDLILSTGDGGVNTVVGSMDSKGIGVGSLLSSSRTRILQ